VNGSFDPAVNLFINPAAFPAQPNSLLGNETRFNPKPRAFPNKGENVSLGKSFAIREPMRLDFRAEAFNLFNRTSHNCRDNFQRLLWGCSRMNSFRKAICSRSMVCPAVAPRFHIWHNRRNDRNQIRTRFK
jgi:hypothetical protein